MSDHPPAPGRVVLRRLAIGDEEQITEAVAEFDAEGRQWSYRHQPDLAWPDYVALVNGWEQGHDLPDGFVTHADLVAEVDGVIVGRSSIRYELNDFLRAQGGHIGYAVRPHHRRRGHATQILRQSLEVLRARDVTPVLVTCDDTNVGSARVIETVGGILENVVPGEPGMPSKRRYWFT